MQLATDRSLIPANTNAVRYLTATITAPTVTRNAERPSVGVALVIDRSGSMEGRKLEMARKAAAHAVQLLSDRDRLAIVVYDNEVDVLVRQAPASAEVKALAAKKLSEVDARGNTDLAGGWTRGLEEMASGTNLPEIRRVLLLSDGLANQGETDPDALAAIAQAWRAKGVSTTTIGVGADFDEALMARLAREGAGNFYFVEHPKQIPDYFASELGEALDIVAKDATFDIAIGPGVTVTTLNDFPVQLVGDKGMRVKLGDLVSGQVVTLGFAVHTPAIEDGEIAAIECRPNDREGRLAAAEVPPMRVTWGAVSTMLDAKQMVSAAVLSAVATLLAARARAEALEANRQGRYAEARAILASCAAELRAMAAGVTGGVKEIERMATELEQREEQFSALMSPIAMKTVLYQSSLERRGRDNTGKAKRASKAS